MPIYEFVCHTCSNRFEVLAKTHKEPAELKCPACGSEEFDRVISRVNSIMGDSMQGDGGQRASVESRDCPSGTCSTITLPGHSR